MSQVQSLMDPSANRPVLDAPRRFKCVPGAVSHLQYICSDNDSWDCDGDATTRVATLRDVLQCVTLNGTWMRSLSRPPHKLRLFRLTIDVIIAWHSLALVATFVSRSALSSRLGYITRVVPSTFFRQPWGCHDAEGRSCVYCVLQTERC